MIESKRDGGALSKRQWYRLVRAAVDGTADEGQLGALLMACVFRGMDDDEIVALTEAMVESGDVITFTAFDDAVDKHSTGGVGDTASLILVPVLAACGVRVAKLSGRALGHTGGTLDKLESIPGFRTDLDAVTFEKNIAEVGCAIAAQSATIVPADKVLYAFRDHTATIPAMGLITASIVAKKVAGGAQTFAFDVKTGSGAFMKTLEESRALAALLVRVSARFGRRSIAIISDMNEPLSPFVGNSLEVVAAREFLKGALRANRLREVVQRLGVALLSLNASQSEAQAEIGRVLRDGQALRKLEEMIVKQGGDLHAFHALTPAPKQHTVTSPRAGFICAVDAATIGHVAREQLERNGSDAGVQVLVQIGDRVEKGASLCIVYGTTQSEIELAGAFRIGEVPPDPRPVIYDVVTG